MILDQIRLDYLLLGYQTQIWQDPNALMEARVETVNAIKDICVQSIDNKLLNVQIA